MTVERHEARGVVWKYLSGDDYGRDERTCADCERRFIATQWFNDGDGDDHTTAAQDDA